MPNKSLNRLYVLLRTLEDQVNAVILAANRKDRSYRYQNRAMANVLALANAINDRFPATLDLRLISRYKGDATKVRDIVAEAVATVGATVLSSSSVSLSSGSSVSSNSSSSSSSS